MTVGHLSVTAIGASHVQRGLPCQDAAASWDLGSGVSLLAVADGAGSAALSHVGSAFAIQLTAQHAEQRWPRTEQSEAGLRAFATGLVSDVAAAFAATAGVSDPLADGDPRTYSTTLAVVVAAWPWILYAGIGDAFLVGCDPDERVHLLVAPSREGDFRNQTQFLGSGSTVECSTVYDHELDGLVLSTDGLEKFIEERLVTGADGNRIPVLWSPSRTFAGLLTEARTGSTPDELSTTFASTEFQKRKGDDIGVSLAWR